MKLGLAKAKRLAFKYLKESKIKDGEFFLIHSKGVASAVRLIAKKHGLDAQRLEALAWVHDIGYFIDEKDHAKHSVKLLKNEKIDLSDTDMDCILNHGTSGKPKTREGTALKIADKLSILDKELLKTSLDYPNEKEACDYLKFIALKASEIIEVYKKEFL